MKDILYGGFEIVEISKPPFFKEKNSYGTTDSGGENSYFSGPLPE